MHNITDINDKIYDAAPGASAELAARATEWYLEDTGDLGLGHARPPAEGDRVGAGDRRTSSRSCRRAGTPTRCGGDVYFRVASFPEYGRLSGQKPDQVERAGAEPAQGGPARLRALEGEQARDRGHVVGLAVGPRPAGLAHRVLGDGRGDLRPGVRDPRRRARPRLPAPRERGRPVARARPSVRAASGRTTACSGSPARRCRSRSATSRRSARRSTSGGARRCSSSSSTRRGASRSTSPTRRWRRRRLARETLRNAFTLRGGPSTTRRGWDGFAERARRRLRHAGRARGAARVGLDRAARAAAPRPRGLRARVARRAGGGARRGRRARRAAGRRRAPSATSRPPTGCATSSPRSAGRCATRRTATTSSRCDARPRLRPAGRPRGPAGQAGGARGLGDRAGASSPSPGSPRPGPG